MTSREVLEVEFDSSTCRAIAEKSPLSDELADKWYGRYHGDKLVLNLVEVAYLLSIGKVVVKGKDGVIESLQGLVSRYSTCFDKSFWPMLSVFKDLRERGRKVSVLAPMKLLVKDKSGDMRIVFVLEEKSPIGIRELIEMLDEARRNNLKATFAIVSLQGELTYYDAVPADLRVE